MVSKTALRQVTDYGMRQHNEILVHTTKARDMLRNVEKWLAKKKLFLLKSGQTYVDLDPFILMLAAHQILKINLNDASFNYLTIANKI